MQPQPMTLVDATGKPLAEMVLTSEHEGWCSGRLVTHQFPEAISKALAWYDEVIENQMLSYLDQAVAAVEQLGLLVRRSDGSTQRIWSLHVDKFDAISFRFGPVPTATSAGVTPAIPSTPRGEEPLLT